MRPTALFLAALAVAAPALLGADGRSAPAVKLSIPTGPALEDFWVDAPDAATSPAARDNSDQVRLPNAPVAAPTTGYTLTSRVIVRAARKSDVVAIANGFKGQVGPLAELPGWWLVDAGTIRNAARLASALRTDAKIAEAYLDLEAPFTLRDPTDPNYPQQWHLNNIVNPTADINAPAAWNLGYTGLGVTIGITELGWQVAHTDIAPNYDAVASQANTGSTSHGTSVAGLVAAVANNGLFGVGVAYNAHVSKQFKGSSATNVAAFGFRNDLNFIKNNSWGPADNGRVSSMSTAERDALQNAVNTGRNGLGLIILWAAGNGGTIDRVDYDPYASSRFTLAVGAIGEDDLRANYNESGSSMALVAPSSSNAPNRSIYSTAEPNTDTTVFGGTSASSPIASGVAALALEANPSLTWRDMQHLLIRTARRNNPANPGWTTNGAGRFVSYDYGFGCVNAAAAVPAAVTWTNVGPYVSTTSGLLAVNVPIPDNNLTGVTQFYSNAVPIRVEAVEVVFSATHPNIGNLAIELTSPAGTHSILAATRSTDPGVNYSNYLFTTFRCWDELAEGLWTLKVNDGTMSSSGTWTNWTLNLYGTCRSDFNKDGFTDSNDVADFLNAWFVELAAGEPVDTDFDGSGEVNSNDVSAFLNAWFVGCGT